MKNKRLAFFIACFMILLLSNKAQNESKNNLSDLENMLYQLGISYPTLPLKKEDPNRPLCTFPSKADNPEGSWKDSLRNTYLRSDFGLWNNYDESKVGSYTPIDLLKMNSGKVITNSSEWWKKRRPELLVDIQTEVWGVIPPDSILPNITFKANSRIIGQGDTAYIQKEIYGKIDVSRYPDLGDEPQLLAVLRIPLNVLKPIPVMIVINSGVEIVDYQQKYCFDNSWAICSFHATLLQPDNQDGLRSYLIGLCNKGNYRKPQDWGSLAAWSWGVSRLIDYFETDEDINDQQIGVFGHSRFGKAALVSMAYEPRLNTAFVSCSGALGAKLSRRNFGETLENVTSKKLYHWCAGNLFKWVSNLGNMPVDAHSLIALCAPRKVFVTGGTNDSWTDPYGMFLTCKYANPVYKLLGKDGVIMPDMKPKENVAYISGNIGYHLHVGGHSDIYDWTAFFDFMKK